MSLLLLEGGIKVVFGLSLLLVVSFGVKGKLLSWVTCFHQEVCFSVVLLGKDWVFTWAEESNGGCLDKETGVSENRVLLLSL